MGCRLAEGDVIYIPAKVKYIGKELFAAYSDTSSDRYYKYEVSKKNKNYCSDKKGWLYSKDKKTLYYARLVNKKNVIPEGVENIALCALYTPVTVKYNMEGKGTVIFPRTLKVISRYPGFFRYDMVFKGSKPPKCVKYQKGESKEKCGFSIDEHHYNDSKILHKNHLDKKIYISKKANKKEYIKKLGITKKYKSRVIAK